MTDEINNEWINCNEELPPCDGKYEITNLREIGNTAIVDYDGYGFLHIDHYVNPRYWKHIKTLEKRYGRIKEIQEKQCLVKFDPKVHKS